jgi:hypothetical protein
MRQENPFQDKALWAARIGTVFYMLWSIVHFQAAVAVFGAARGLQLTPVQGRVNQDAFFLLSCAIAVLVVSVVLTWRNSPLGYWLDLAIAGVADVGFIAFVLAPGHAQLWPGLEGPIAWALGWAFTTYGLVGRAGIPADQDVVSRLATNGEDG